MDSITEILSRGVMSHKDITSILSIDKQRNLEELYKKSFDVKQEYLGNKVFLRGIIEFSNVCSKNCYYCGIRRDNRAVERYTLSDEEIIKEAEFAYKSGYGSIVLQSGEKNSKEFIDRVQMLVKRIKKVSDRNLGITLSLGEQSFETYRKWFEAGAHRYLLRIETSNPELYSSLHPEDHDFSVRLRALKDLREAGYQVGTGMMIGLPGQTLDDIASDIEFMRDMDIDMVGMGPYIPHSQTPLAESAGGFDEERKRRQVELSLKCIACVRLLLKDVNIAATTALQALDPFGREKGIKAGANVIMPNVTAGEYREGYKLYDDKPCVNENSEMCKNCLDNRIRGTGAEIGYNQWGDSPHYFKRGL